MNQAFTMSDEIKNDDPMDNVSSTFLALRTNKFVLSEFFDSIQSICKTVDAKTNLIYISQRSTQPIIESIELLCETVLSNFLNIRVSDEKTLHFYVFNYLVYFTKFEKRWLLQLNTDYESLYKQYETKQLLISPYLFMEIVCRLRYDAFLAESMLYLPVDVCAEILEILPRCILMLDFSRALKFTTTIIINVYKLLDSLQNNLGATKDVVIETRKLVDNLSEIIALFNLDRFLKLNNLQKLDVHKHHGLVLKALVRMLMKCLKSEPEQRYQILGKYSPEYTQNLSPECYSKHRESIHALLVNLLLHKVQSIDFNCYLDWTEFDDEEQPDVSLQQAIGIECYYFLKYPQDKLSGESYELLVQSLGQIASTPPAESTKAVDKSTLGFDAVYTDLLQDLIQFLLKKFNENSEYTSDTSTDLSNYAKNIDKVLAKLNIDQLIDFIHVFVLKILGAGEIHFSKLNCASCDVQLDANFSDNDPLNLLFKDPERRTEDEYKRFLIRLFFRPEETVEKIAHLAIGHADYDLMNGFSFENIDLIVDVLKTPVPNAYDDLLECLIERAGIENEEKADIMEKKGGTREERPTVPLAIKVLQKIAIKSFSSNQPHLTICLKTLVDKGIASVDLIVEELLIPLLLVPSCALDSVLLYLQFVGTAYKSQDPLYSAFLVRLLEKLPYARCCDRYHASKLLSRTHDLCELLFDLPSYETLAAKVSRYRYYQKITFDNRDLSKVFIARDVLRHELLHASELHCLGHMHELVVKDGRWLLSRSSEAEVLDALVRIAFEACLLSLEFPARFSPRTPDFIFNLLPVILRLTRKKDFAKVCQSLIRHAESTGLSDVMVQSTFKERWDEIINSWEVMSKSGNVEMRDWTEMLDSLIITDDEELVIFERKKSPLAIQLLLSEKIVSHLISKKCILELDDKIKRCFDLTEQQ